jgi:hypothetical protein
MQSLRILGIEMLQSLFPPIANRHIGSLPSFKTAQESAKKGNLYCWWCASPNVEKHGSKHGTEGRKYKFVCQDCTSHISYAMPREVYLSLPSLKSMKLLDKVNSINKKLRDNVPSVDKFLSGSMAKKAPNKRNKKRRDMEYRTKKNDSSRKSNGQTYNPSLFL